MLEDALLINYFTFFGSLSNSISFFNVDFYYIFEVEIRYGKVCHKC